MILSYYLLVFHITEGSLYQTIEFNSKQNCEVAANLLQKKVNTNYQRQHYTYECVEK